MRPETIKRNLRMFLGWCLEQGFSFHQVDFFSGEIWHGPFGWEVLDILLEYIRRGLRIEDVMIPTNASFVLSDRAAVEMANRIEDYGKACCRLILFGSIDGALSDEITRRGNDGHLTEEKNGVDFYDRFFSFWRRFGSDSTPWYPPKTCNISIRISTGGTKNAANTAMTLSRT